MLSMGWVLVIVIHGTFGFSVTATSVPGYQTEGYCESAAQHAMTRAQRAGERINAFCVIGPGQDITK
jgi:hypothetical protein